MKVYFFALVALLSFTADGAAQQSTDPNAICPAEDHPGTYPACAEPVTQCICYYDITTWADQFGYCAGCTRQYSGTADCHWIGGSLGEFPLSEAVSAQCGGANYKTWVCPCTDEALRLFSVECDQCDD